MAINTLFIDTALSGVSLGVHNERTGESFQASIETVRGQAEKIVPMICTLLKDAGLAFKDLGQIVTTLGPGSFTGLRIGLSVAKSLALSLDIPVKGINTFNALALTADNLYASDNYNFYAIVIETKRSDYYFSIFDNALNSLCPPHSCDADAALNQIVNLENVLVVGDAADRLTTSTDDTDLNHTRVTTVNAGLLASHCAANAESLQSHVTPLYLRDADTSSPQVVPRKIAVT